MRVKRQKWMRVQLKTEVSKKDSFKNIIGTLINKIKLVLFDSLDIPK